MKLIKAVARCRPDALADPWAQSVLVAAKMLAQRVLFLETQANTLEAHFGLRPTVISRIERGLQRDDTFADTYRNWLKAA
ncbi:MAG: hypothetical protein K0U67_00655 [Actinomycetia bacterium]|nr:hypothetical protein [Actinomycetes bacterium]